MKPVRIAVFGVGRWGVHLVRNFLNHPQSHLVAVVDPNQERLTDLAQRFSLTNVQLLTDWHTALDLDEVEAVAIATPATTHYPLIQAALHQGKHVLAEKPLTLNGQECLVLCQLAQQQQRQLVVDHTYLFHPAVQQGKHVMQDRLIGDTRYGYATRTHLGPVRQDVDALWDLAIHDIAILNYWLGATPVSVQAQGTVWLQPYSSDIQRFPKGLSDLVWVKLQYPGNVQIWIHLCWNNPDKQRRLCMVGSQGTLIFDELNPSSLILQHGDFEQQNELFIPTHQHTQVLPVEPAEPLRQVCTHFLNCVQQNTPSTISSGEVGTQLVNILCALTESLQQEGVVVTLNIV